MRKAAVAAATVMMIAGIVVVAGQPSDSSGYQSFQLVYHSDTRGYYRPCG